MIRLNVNEQQLFDLIMAVYAQASADSGQDGETAQRREALLDKLHRAFDTKIMAPQGETPAGAMRLGAQTAAAMRGRRHHRTA